MNARRLFLASTLVSPWLFMAVVAEAETEFERYKREQAQGVKKLSTEWQVYQKNYRAAYRQYVTQLSKVWDKPEVSTQKEWVEYSENMQVKRVVDFEKNQVRISFTGVEAESISQEKLNSELQSVRSEEHTSELQSRPHL